MAKNRTSDEVLNDIIKLDTQAQIQLGYKIQDILKEKANALQSQKSTVEEELNSIATALKAQS